MSINQYDSNGLLKRSADPDFLIEVARGNVAGASLVHKFGRNDGVPNGSFELISLKSTATQFLGSALTMRIKAGGDANDTAAGTGAREVTIQGIAADLTETSEAIATKGALVSDATTTQFWRVYRAWVSSVGTYGQANAADITIENTGVAADQIVVGAGEGQSQCGTYTIPTGKTGYLLSVHVTADGLKAADIRMFTRADITDTTAPMASKRLKLYWDGILGDFSYKPRSPGAAIPALSDVWFEAQGSGAGTEVSVDFELLLIDD
jgi:hypothetical protein